MLIGYARVSTAGQKLDVQTDALKEAGCELIFTDKMSGAKRARPGLKKMLDQIAKDDTLVVVRLDRLARSTIDLLKIGESLNEIGAGLRSIGDPWADTTTAQGRLLLGIMGALAEFERELIVERSAAGRKRARKNGVRFGRPPRLAPTQVERAREYLADGMSLRQIEQEMGIPKSTLHSALSAD